MRGSEGMGRRMFEFSFFFRGKKGGGYKGGGDVGDGWGLFDWGIWVIE